MNCVPDTATRFFRLSAMTFIQQGLQSMHIPAILVGNAVMDDDLGFFMLGL
jgi:hypothetical protein